LEFAGHAWQTSEVAAKISEYFAATHAVHRALPGAFLYFPASHALHNSPFGPVKPTLHVQSVLRVLATGELELDRHNWQTSVVAAVAPEYCPTKQSLHAALPV